MLKIRLAPPIEPKANTAFPFPVPVLADDEQGILLLVLLVATLILRSFLAAIAPDAEDVVGEIGDARAPPYVELSWRREFVLAFATVCEKMHGLPGVVCMRRQ